MLRLALKQFAAKQTSLYATEYSRPLAVTITRKYSSEKPSSFVGKSFITLRDFSANEIQTLLWTGIDLKTRIKERKEIYQPLIGKSLAMIFQKRSTRTRLSTETGFSLLGGHAAFLSPSDIHLGVSESLKDSSRVLSGFCDVILARVYGHADILELSNEASVPVINGLSDLYHPLQILADFITLQERFGRLQGLTAAWVGDGDNNLTHSFMLGCVKLGINLRVAVPKGYECNTDVTKACKEIASQNGSELSFTSDPRDAVHKANVVVTDTWVSMGMEEEKAKRLKDFNGFQVDKNMVKEAADDWAFMHCLPRKQEEVTDDVFYGPDSIVWQEAENRKWSVMAVLLHVLQDHIHQIPKPKFQVQQLKLRVALKSNTLKSYRLFSI